MKGQRFLRRIFIAQNMKHYCYKMRNWKYHKNQKKFPTLLNKHRDKSYKGAGF